jgi:spore germination protein GerM
MRILVPILLVTVATAACGETTPSAQPEREQSPVMSSPSASVASTAAASPGTPAASPRSALVAVYWLGAGESPRGPRLYREFLQRPATADPVRDAVTAMLEGAPRDPDYDSLWAAGTALRNVEREGTTAVVDLSRQAQRNGGGSAFEAMTLQQLVHTVTAADPSLKAVRLLVEGEPVETLWGSADASRPLTRAPAAGTLAPVWLDVADGATIDGSFGGTASVFEATVSWELRSGSRVVDEGFDTASAGAPGRGEWSATTDAPPGDYELWAYESSAEDGSVAWLDTKRVTVRG